MGKRMKGALSSTNLMLHSELQEQNDYAKKVAPLPTKIKSALKKT
jgi:hypothetical protein